MSKSVDIAFVILHYNAIKETIQCVESIEKNIDTDNYAVIIVDNCSPNGTGKQLSEKYNGHEKCYVIESSENLGFAKGNNLGIDFARKKLQAQYVCCTNNDTIILDKKFFGKVTKEYRKTKFAVLAPRAITAQGDVQLYFGRILSLKAYEEELVKLTNLLKEGRFNVELGKKRALRVLFEKNPLGRKLVGFWRTLKNRAYSTKYDEMLHGCCLVFSPAFFEKLSGFYDKTFMYREEELLYLEVRNADMHTVYKPTICIKHLEDVATDSEYETNEKKNKFMFECKVDSLKVLIDYLKSKDV
ncbi:MAG: glycosyltransferase family 2 protein [Lachnospiraceae bacterium]|nr:glycosyltransferase family 2 protein [Lachnospiraceae bacterium]